MARAQINMICVPSAGKSGRPLSLEISADTCALAADQLQSLSVIGTLAGGRILDPMAELIVDDEDLVVRLTLGEKI